MAELSEFLINDINHAVGEALMLRPGEETAVLATVVSGYIELVSLNPANAGYVERLSAGLFRLAEFLAERGHRDLTRKFVLLRDQVLETLRPPRSC